VQVYPIKFAKQETTVFSEILSAIFPVAMASLETFAVYVI
jgi:hypothetical protein